MRVIRLLALAIFVTALALSTAERFTVEGQSPTDALTGFGETNGFVDQETYDFLRTTFNRQLQIADGLGPVYNAQSCGECHQNPVSGGISQVTVLRAGRLDFPVFNFPSFIDQVGGSLINDRAIDASLQERVLVTSNVRTFRTSLNTLGDGYVEAIDSNTLIDIANNQPTAQRGTVIRVPVLESPGALRVGRFGWKNQHASLLSAAAEEYLNQIGITSPLQPVENTSNGESVADFDAVRDPDERPTESDPNGAAVEAVARFMRSTRAPRRGEITDAAIRGASLFRQIGCEVCHVATIRTAAYGTVINGGTFIVTPAHGNKLIHPYSDFLLHNIGTGDGIVQNGGQRTRNMVRTAPLWGLRTRNRLMHDGESLTLFDAIQRHAGQATGARNIFNGPLSEGQRNDVLAFLRSL